MNHLPVIRKIPQPSSSYHVVFHCPHHCSGKVARGDEAVSPFTCFAEGYEKSFAGLYDALHNRRSILYAAPCFISPPKLRKPRN